MVFTGWLNRIDAIGVGMVVAILLAITSPSAALAKDDTLFTSDFAGLNEEQTAFAARAIDFFYPNGGHVFQPHRRSERWQRT